MPTDPIEERLKKIEAEVPFATWPESPTRWLIAQVRTLRQRVAEVEEERKRVVLRLGCIARVTENHDSHVCPADDCMECWPGDLADEFKSYSEVLRAHEPERGREEKDGVG